MIWGQASTSGIQVDTIIKGYSDKIIVITQSVDNIVIIVSLRNVIIVSLRYSYVQHNKIQFTF